ncbi:unnamed protein product [Ranitomeya imitator]|uniref:Sema domain-containing protein n=1 Tax=Ranitomeya imitator TaxID=111125 RepID=A0ABN9KYJ3_9NEOB|nr:unnamed protein product [Ranitomeya imitator]
MWTRCWILLIFWASSASTWQCPAGPFQSLDPNVHYDLLHFTIPGLIQNVAAKEDPDALLFLTAANRLHVVRSSDLHPLQELITGPTDFSGCSMCAGCEMGSAHPGRGEDTDSIVLLVDPEENFLFRCGSSLRGLCYLHRFNDSEIVRSSCLFRPQDKPMASCPDCIASPLGTTVALVQGRGTIYFYVASSVDSEVIQNYGTTSISIRRFLSSEDGFGNFQSLTVLPLAPERLPHPLRPHLQHRRTCLLLNRAAGKSPGPILPEPAGPPQHRKFGHEKLVLDCRVEEKRRRRSEPRSFNVLQAAHVVVVGKDLAAELNLDLGDLVLFAAFAQSEPNSEKPVKMSAVCAFPLKLIDQFIMEGMKKCCSVGDTERPSRGLRYYQDDHYCPQNASDTDLSCWGVPTLVTPPMTRVDLFNGRMSGILLTALYVTTHDPPHRRAPGYR